MSETRVIPTDMDEGDLRAGELVFPPEGLQDGDARLRPIGRVRSNWSTRGECPKNVRQARETGHGARLEIAPPFRAALRGLEVGQWVLILTWLDRARRDLALQMPRHSTEPTGTFALRSPVRPNPIGLHLVRLTSLDAVSGVIGIDAVDVLDGTPLLDLKPYLPSVDAPPAGSD